jgi:hypothetical protein
VTSQFDEEELLCLRSVIPFVNQGMSMFKAKHMLEIIGDITDKYQLEIIKPSLDFVLASAITPSDYYEFAKLNLDTLNK